MFEDIDAIFGKDREKLLTDSVLTFSGDGRGIVTIDFVPSQLLEVSDVWIFEFEIVRRTESCAGSESKNLEVWQDNIVSSCICIFILVMLIVM